jgi:hypothetical protein
VPQSADNTSFTSFVRGAAVAAIALFLYPAPARADWLLSAYLGTSRTASNTVAIEPDTGGLLDVGPIAYETRPFTSPVYYSGRFTYFLTAIPWLGIGGEWTHNKAIADVDQLVGINGGTPVPLSVLMSRLEMTNGLNVALANIVVRHPVAIGSTGDRLSLMGFAGLGVAVPHVETVFAGATKFEYQVTGLGWQVGGGVEWRLVKGLSAIADLRVTSGRQRLDLGTGTLTGTFTSTQADFGVAWHIGGNAARPNH